MKIAVIGTGYVGLVVGACFADSGNDAVCVDINSEKISRLRAGEVPIYEPGLAELIERNVREGRLAFTTDLAGSVGEAQVVFIAVGTPEGESGDADLHYVLAAAEELGRALRQYTVVVDKSTVPVGTAERVRRTIAAVTRVEFDVVSNPEFLKEGAAIEDFTRPDRVVIGTDSERARAVMADLYAPFVRTGSPLLFMDTASAELTKYAANAMLATRISFMNDIACLCEKVGADVEMVRKGMGADKRIGHSFLFPGVGYGGSCFPKDVKALGATAREVGFEFELLRAVERTNERQKRLLVHKALRHLGPSLEGRQLAVWGLAFKPRTDDMREAPSVELIEGLLAKGARVVVHDPVAMVSARRVFGNRITYAPGPYAAAEGAEALFIVTEWNEFRQPDFERLKSLMRAPIIFDGRNLFEPERMRARGFTYFCLGRG
ncbi:UDP-glucose/GDP-mannose dehydrogenase family protein [Vitiosangium sp. GDMCC 1.1324]|uniref:UDP-glucose dehydrogenase family protein n=1 Tax=Vitiosangium sp. (strain GDMCC 1.1324) TaxID=2138576 RepID=UPI000D3A2768|nr:UDP-glucose/GDP-mannose dehydrogenase family protein [Vitiosangium sp. GDMCC 1.1324]PTL81101.1 UDP-glucose 6-dehydrogenase [Vitiosangium sp. GDMCC 1.1324]